MIDLGNRIILDDGTVLCDESAAVEILYAGLELSDAVLKPTADLELFSNANSKLDAGLKEPLVSNSEIYKDINWYNTWVTPIEYKSINILNYCLIKCSTDEQRDRVHYEIKLFEQRDMIPVLQHLIYLVDEFRKKKILWGVGRGSSVSSYVLYLIGINRINPLEFNLDIKEFLK